MERQRQADCDQVGSIDCDRKPSFRVFTKWRSGKGTSATQSRKKTLIQSKGRSARRMNDS